MGRRGGHARGGLGLAGNEQAPRPARLAGGALGLFDSVVMAVAGSAPAYSIAATTATLVATVGLGGPAALLYAGIPMFGVAWAFLYLGRTGANAGASYHWVARSLHPVLGYMAGWALVVSATLFMVAGSLPAGAVTLGLINPAAADNVLLVTTVGAGWFLLMAAMVLVGVRVTANVQWIMSSVEVAVLVLLAVLALAHARPASAAPATWAWLGLGAFHGIGGFAGGVVVAAFYYWGWDVTANLNEETRAPRRVPGLAGVVGLAVVLCLFVTFATIANMRLSPREISANSADVLLVLGRTVWPGPGGPLLVLAVLLSTVATLETTLIQVSRTVFAMARDRVAPARLAYVHPRWRTPLWATILVAALALTLFVLSSLVGSVSAALSNAVNAIALQIVVYYTLAAVSVVVYYRHMIFRSLSNFLFIGLWPSLGAVFMLGCGLYDVPQLSPVSLAVGLGLLAVGLVPLALYRARGVAYFHAPRMHAVDADGGEAAG